MKNIRFILKFALGAALAYAVGNVLHSSKITYILYGASLNIHPIAGETALFVRDKVKASAIGASFGMLVESAFQGNQIAALAIGPPLLMAGGYWFGVPRRVLTFSAIVVVAAAGNSSFTSQPFEYIGIRYWNMFIGSAVGMAVNVFLWPETDTDKLYPSFAKVITSIRQLYDQTINDYLQGSLSANAQSRRQLIAGIEIQLSGIDALMGTAKEELWYFFINDAPYQDWITLQPRVNALFASVVDLGNAMEGGDSDRLYQGVKKELEDLIEATRASFEHFSQVSAFQSSQPFENPLANLPQMRAAILERRIQLGSTRRPEDLDPDEIKRLSASIYSLWTIASELKDLADAMNSSVISS